MAPLAPIIEEAGGRLTDLDGSIWWWPFRVGATDPTAPQRDPKAMKCGWAAGVYVCLLVGEILGLRADRPARKVSLRPFCPWPEFTWTRCRLGESLFDVVYHKAGGEVSAEIVNRNGEPYDGLIELTLPEGAAPGSCRPADVQQGRRYGRASVIHRARIAPGQTLRLCARWD